MVEKTLDWWGDFYSCNGAITGADYHNTQNEYASYRWLKQLWLTLGQWRNPVYVQALYKLLST